MKPEISVIIPTRNRGGLLRTTLQSVLNQCHVAIEVIVVDDGSTADIATSALRDRRVRVIRHHRPLGVSTARNHGADAAAGSWLAFCDDDDLWAPDKLARQLAAAMKTQRTWAYAGAVRVDPALRIIGGDTPPAPETLARRLPRWNLMPGGSSNVIVQSDAFRAAGRWDPALRNLADWDLWNRLARQGLPAYVDAPLVGYRIHPGNASSDTRLVLREAALLDGRYGAPLDHGELHYYLAWVSLRRGRRGPALAHLVRAAAGGQVRGAVRSLMLLVEARVRRHLGAPPPRLAAPGRWALQADSWLARLREAGTE